MSAALFTRRAKSGWLDELDGIRGDALAHPRGGVDEAMADDDADPMDDADAEQAASPLTALEAPLPPPPGAATPSEPVDPPLPPPPPAAAVPSPHPSRPEEMWHPGIDLGQAIAPPPPPQPVADGSEPDDVESPPGRPADSGGRFSFARLRAVLPNPDPNEPALSESPVGPGEDRPSLLSELVAPYATPEDTDQPVGGPEEFWPPVEARQVPVVPPTATPSGQSLISGPVQRRGDTAGPDRRRGFPPVVAVDHRAPAVVPVDAAPTQDPDPAFEPESSAPVVDASQPDPVEIDIDIDIEDEGTEPSTESLDALPEAAEVEPEAAAAEPGPDPDPEPAGPKTLDVEADHTVRLADGHLRFAQHPGSAPLLDDDGVEATLGAGWCWVCTGPSQPDRVSVRLSSLTLRVGPSTTALVAVEDDGATFVVIAAGEATLEHPATRLHLRRGAMALTAPGSEPQADMATDEEIASDPLVAENQRLDLTR